jgi:hypothetical protein
MWILCDLRNNWCVYARALHKGDETNVAVWLVEMQDTSSQGR